MFSRYRWYVHSVYLWERQIVHHRNFYSSLSCTKTQFHTFCCRLGRTDLHGHKKEALHRWHWAGTCSFEVVQELRKHCAWGGTSAWRGFLSPRFPGSQKKFSYWDIPNGKWRIAYDLNLNYPDENFIDGSKIWAVGIRRCKRPLLICSWLSTWTKIRQLSLDHQGIFWLCCFCWSIVWLEVALWQLRLSLFS